MSTWKKIAVVGLFMGVAGAGCEKKPAPALGKRGAREASFPVEVIQVDAQPRELSVVAPGVVDAFEQIQITARVSGVVDKVAFADGQEVKLAQVLALIDNRRYALSVSAARAAMNKAEATAADTGQSLKRRENAILNNPGLIPGEELETYKTRLRTAQADVAQAHEALKLAQLNLEDSSVKAPAAGIIQTRSVQTGQYVQAGTVIATLLRRDPMLLRFNLTTAEAPRIKVGTLAEFKLKESQEIYQAKITLISGAADPESRLVPVTAEVISEKKFWLRPGSFAQVQIKLTSPRQFPMIPQTAVRPSDRGFLAYVIEGDIAHERTLELGMHTSDGLVEARKGIEAGNLLVTRGIEALSEGTKVRIIPAAGAGSKAANATNPAASASAGPRRRRAGAGETEAGNTDSTDNAANAKPGANRVGTP